MKDSKVVEFFSGCFFFKDSLGDFLKGFFGYVSLVSICGFVCLCVFFWGEGG